MLLVAGQRDGKFSGIKRRMLARLRQGLAAQQQQQQQQQEGRAGSAGGAPDTNGSSRVVCGEAAAAAAAPGASADTDDHGGAMAHQQQRQQIAGVHKRPLLVHQWAEVPGAGHAVHVEAPLQLLSLVQDFMELL
jgi:pimeloyl-ACP methyl ester carboxylesterase